MILNYDLPKIQKVIENCLETFMKKDIFLLEHDVDERTVSHRFAFYLQSEIPEMHVDCEYNREGFEIKKISGPKWIKPRNIYPDIVVHKRGTDSNNILIIEVKKQTNKDIENDEIKLKAFTSEQYRYSFGLLVIFYTKEKSLNDPILRWFSNGKEYYENSQRLDN